MGLKKPGTLFCVKNDFSGDGGGERGTRPTHTTCTQQAPIISPCNLYGIK